MSRTSLDWGIRLPWDDRHVAYVWFDALTNYLSATGFGDPTVDYTERWPVDYHLIGKDIIRHHCVYWPAMLMSAGVDLPKGWAVGGWLLVDGEKMAKSTGNVVNPLDLVDTVGVDGFRYYVLAETSYGSDGDFSYDGLVARYNSDLANNLGNLASRVATVVGKSCGGIGPAPAMTPPRRRRGDRGSRHLGRLGCGNPVARPRGDLVADPSDQRLPRGQRALEDDARCRSRRGDGRRPRSAADRHPARLARRSVDLGRDLGTTRPRWLGGGSAIARRRPLGRLSGRPDRDEG